MNLLITKHICYTGILAENLLGSLVAPAASCSENQALHTSSYAIKVGSCTTFSVKVPFF